MTLRLRVTLDSIRNSCYVSKELTRVTDKMIKIHIVRVKEGEDFFELGNKILTERPLGILDVKENEQLKLENQGWSPEWESPTCSSPFLSFDFFTHLPVRSFLSLIITAILQKYQSLYWSPDIGHISRGGFEGHLGQLGLYEFSGLSWLSTLDRE